MSDPCRPARFRPSRGAAFTLLELIVAMSIIVLLLALTIPAFGPALQSANLSSAGSQIVDQLNFARQTALSRNRAVEVRFYGPKNAGDGQLQKVIALRLLMIEENGSERPLANLARLPTGIIISGDHNAPDKSSLLKVAAADQVAPRAGQETPPLPGNLTDYVAFQFQRDGGTDLDVNGPSGNAGSAPAAAGQSSWHLTLRSENARVLANALPANYVTVQLDPLTGRVRVYRP